MRLIFLRHGRTNFNDLGLCNDNPAVNVHLTPVGVVQANQAAAALHGQIFDRIFVSELPRTRHTAAIVNQNRQVPVEIRAELNDIRTGFDGLPVAEYFAAVRDAGHDARASGGESVRDHKARVWKFLGWLRTQHFQTVLVVAHEETYRALAAYLLGLSDDAMVQLHLDNCAYREFTLAPEHEFPTEGQK